MSNFGKVGLLAGPALLLGATIIGISQATTIPEEDATGYVIAALLFLLCSSAKVRGLGETLPMEGNPHV